MQRFQQMAIISITNNILGSRVIEGGDQRYRWIVIEMSNINC